MRRIIFFIILTIPFISIAQVSKNITLLSHFQDEHLASIDWTTGHQIWNGCKGWADTIKHREYAIAGSVDSIYFFDITTQSVMKKVAVKNGFSHAVNRDFDVFDHYVYCVSDNVTSGSAQGKLQIFDLQYLPDSVHTVYESKATGSNTHTIFINKKSKRLYKCINRYRSDSNTISSTNAMEIYSLRDPENPSVMAKLSRTNYSDVHESYVRNDTVYCSSGDAGIFFYDMTDTSHIKKLGSIEPPYPDNAYNHSNWLDSSGKYILFTDETADGKGMKIYDISDLANPKVVGTPFRNYGSPHNSYWVGRYAYTSMYYGGINIYDMKNVNAPDFVAYYRTFSNQHTPNIYEGCWGIYPFLPSGNIIASDMNTGIYLFRLEKNLLGINSPENDLMSIRTFPNPFIQNISISISNTEKQSAHLLVYDLHGKIAAEKTAEFSIGENTIELTELQNHPKGIYFVKIISNGEVFHQSIVKQE